MTKIPCATLLLTSAALFIHSPASAQTGRQIAAADAGQDLSRLSIEELADLSVRSASKRDEPLSSAPTALFVITGDEILASSATSLPEALRLAPNLNVQQVDARQYAISARGFNSIETSNKLLVLIDGRSIYTPLASSVFWELHNRLIEDIQQIEVISGSGGTLHGPNAVNGVVNFITRDARDTVGAMARGTLGNRERTFGARVGTPLGSSGAVRFYGQYFQRDALDTGVGSDLDDRFEGWQAGFRADLGSGADMFTLQGDVFDTDVDTGSNDGDSGHNFIARWTRDLGIASSLRVQAYYDYFERDYLGVHDSVQTFDVEAQFNRTIGVHDIVAGLGLRTTRDEFINDTNIFQLNPQSQRLWLFNAFVQDRIALTGALDLILGLKAERTSFTGVELLPNVRLAWQPDGQILLWAAVSRAVRTPSRIDRQLEAPGFLDPAPDFRSEKLIAFEVGYRGQPLAHTILSVSAFFNLYDDIRSLGFADGAGLPFQLGNSLRGQTYGIEAWSSSEIAPWLRLNLGLTTLWKNVEGTDLAAGEAFGYDPEYQLFARIRLNLADRLELNVGLRQIGGIDRAPSIPSYTEADARLGYRIGDNLELYVAGSNLLHRRHAESNDIDRAQLAERSLYAGARVRF